MLDKTKRAAKFMGYPVVILQGFEYYELSDKEIIPIEDYKPYEELGRHWLVEIERKLTFEQFDSYIELIEEQLVRNGVLTEEKWPIAEHLVRVAPSELCFEKLMEVIK